MTSDQGMDVQFATIKNIDIWCFNLKPMQQSMSIQNKKGVNFVRHQWVTHG